VVVLPAEREEGVPTVPVGTRKPGNVTVKLKNSESWHVSLDFPEELQFASYIAQREDFTLGEEGGAKSPAEIEWRSWWDRLVSHLPAKQEAMRQGIDPRTVTEFDPPAFNSLEAMPGLQTICEKHWPMFHQHWGTVGGQMTPNMEKLLKQLQRVRLDQIVKECMREVGKTKSNPFKLRVDFVQWPARYLYRASGQHVVLGAQFVEPEHIDELTTILKTTICLLV
jgi:hypothetical protein